jgi:predicted transposase YdaD
MSKPFDATTRDLIESDPRAWAEFLLGRKLDRVRILNVDLSTITTEADSVLEIDEAEPWLVHVEFQSGYDATLPRRLLRYNVLVNHRHERPVQSIALLLCRDADGPGMTGLLQRRLPDGFLYQEFRYNVVRVWECPADQILVGGLATLPLAPIGKVDEAELPSVIQAMQRRLDQETTQDQASTLWTATFLLMGTKYDQPLIDQLLQGVRGMKESVTYQAILREGRAEGRVEGREEGRIEEAKRILKRLGGMRFGKPEPNVGAAIDALLDLGKLEFLTDRLLDVSSWEELLGETTDGSAPQSQEPSR